MFDETVYVPKTEGKVGFGGYIFSDRNGLVSRTGFQTCILISHLGPGFDTIIFWARPDRILLQNRRE